MMVSALLLVAAIPIQHTKTTTAVEEFMKATGAVGLSIEVWEEGHQIYSRGFGWENREERIPASPDTVYRLGSVSKPITAIAIMNSVEKGRLDLDKDIRTWVKEWPEDKPGVTLRHIMHHTSGIRHYAPLEGAVYDHFSTSAEALNRFKNSALIAKVGEKFSYSTHAWTLAAAALEKAEAQPFPDIISQMALSTKQYSTLQCEDLTKPAMRNRSALYQSVKDKEAILETRREDNSWKYAGGGMESRSYHLAGFISVYMMGELVEPMTTNPVNGRGLGWAVKGDTFEHGGSQQGCSAFVKADKKSETIVVVLCNTQGVPAKQLGDQVMAIWRR